MEDLRYIKENFDSLKEEISELSHSLGTTPPRIVCVTKSGSDEEILELARIGATEMGENRPQEVKRRYELLKEQGLDVKMHEIGTLQRNKVKLVALCAEMIHSVDSLKLASDINRHAETLGRKIPILIEINSAKEEQKSGVLPEDAERLLTEISELNSITVSGLMTMGPVVDDPEEIRQYFRLTKKLFDSLNVRYGFGENPTLSMGMSDSYRVAIEEGSTLVRVGRRLFIK